MTGRAASISQAGAEADGLHLPAKPLQPQVSSYSNGEAGAVPSQDAPRKASPRKRPPQGRTPSRVT
eukprot:CAMPEP_0195150744 /NCGR_PEP_ID=MMETSP0448-20130528/179356_1 /TAXON_ID=66468 /ORGANISM="Heterocapsa triquestra, Strain CCMP 448" /LENGTH=65 /DNA_ID=CAMNT_0040189435 /DNA_START=23 /DNA_END=217 /DNA_ORIENTATION=+